MRRLQANPSRRIPNISELLYARYLDETIIVSRDRINATKQNRLERITDDMNIINEYSHGSRMTSHNGKKRPNPWQQRFNSPLNVAIQLCQLKKSPRQIREFGRIIRVLRQLIQKLRERGRYRLPIRPTRICLHRNPSMGKTLLLGYCVHCISKQARLTRAAPTIHNVISITNNALLKISNRPRVALKKIITEGIPTHSKTFGKLLLQYSRLWSSHQNQGLLQPLRNRSLIFKRIRLWQPSENRL